jgi:hypothetical protein
MISFRLHELIISQFTAINRRSESPGRQYKGELPRTDEMKFAPAVLLIIALMDITAMASTNVDKAACKKVKQQIRAIEARMRDGYSAAQGIRLDERLRKLKEKRYKLCR